MYVFREQQRLGHGNGVGGMSGEALSSYAVRMCTHTCVCILIVYNSILTTPNRRILHFHIQSPCHTTPYLPQQIESMPSSQILSISAAATRSDMDSQAMYISEAQYAINSP